MRPAWSPELDPTTSGSPGLALPPAFTREWAWDGATGAGIKVAVLDSGIDAGHPAVGSLAGAVRIEPDGRAADGFRAVLGDHADLYGHGTACASLIRQAAPDAELFSVQVLGSQLRGAAAALVTGLRWAIDNGMDVVNLSLGTQVESWAGTLHALADEAYFQRVMLVCAASNRPRAAFPGVFASVFSVAAHDRHDPFDFDYNPNPPVEIAAPGVAVRAAWLDGATVTLTGNSYAAAHVSGIVARILSKHPGLTPFQMKTVLAAVATNAESRPAEPTEGSR